MQSRRAQSRGGRNRTDESDDWDAHLGLGRYQVKHGSVSLVMNCVKARRREVTDRRCMQENDEG